jgi:prophage tail gpP-like protein
MKPITLLCEANITGELALKPSRLTVTRSLSSPAASLGGVFPVKRWPNEIARATLLLGGEPLLQVFPDRQTASLSDRGMSLELSARSKGASLLDNEAWPHTYRNYTTGLIFTELISSYGFTLDGENTGTLGEFTVRKGWSVWDAFSAFTRRVHGVVPWVRGDSISISPPRGEEPVSLGGKERPIAALSRTIDRYEPISQIYIRNAEGEYSSIVTNHDAAGRDIRRVRFLIPAGEFTTAPFWDARQRIQRSMREFLTLKATLPGYLDILPGQGVHIDHPRVSRPDLLVDEVRFTLDEKGARTDLNLHLAIHYDT